MQKFYSRIVLLLVWVLAVDSLIKSGSKTRLSLEKASEDTLEYLGSLWAPSSALCALRCPELKEYWRELYKYDKVSQRCDCFRNSNSFVHAPSVLPLLTRTKFVYKSRFRLFFLFCWQPTVISPFQVEQWKLQVKFVYRKSRKNSFLQKLVFFSWTVRQLLFLQSGIQRHSRFFRLQKSVYIHRTQCDIRFRYMIR